MEINFIGNRHLGKETGWWYYFNMQGDTIRRTYTKSINALRSILMEGERKLP